MGTMTEAASPATVLSVASDGGEDFADPVLADAQPDKIYSALEYADAINGAAIRYENYANTIKESIIITAPQVEYVYSFRMATEGLMPSLQEDGSVLLILPDGNVPYRIPAPYMFDSNYETSYDASYTLTSVGDEWIFTVTADAAWLNAEDRAFPVYLDPTVEEKAGSEVEICGNFVRSGYPDSPDPTTEDLYVGHNGNNNGLTRTYLHVNDLVDLPNGCEIFNATISLYHVVHAYRTAGADIEVGAYAITKAGNLDGSDSVDAWRDWADNLNWTKTTNGTTTTDSVILDKQTLGNQTTGHYVSWDITTLAYDWYDSVDHYKNLGIAFRVIADDDVNTVGSRAAFRGAGNTNYSSEKPRMKISYRNTRGIEDRYTYQTLNIGRAGTSYISDYTLQNTHIVPLFSSPSNVMPFSVSLVYNTSMTGRYFSKDYDGVNTQNYNEMLVGIGWKLSLQQSVVPVTVGGVTYLVYTDADGTEHYFHNTGSSYQDEDGLSLTITKSGTTYTMTNPYGDTWIFVNGYLTEQTDAYGNALYYCYNEQAYNSESTAWQPNASGPNKVTAVYRQIAEVSATEQLLKIEYSGIFVSKIIGECDYSNSSSAEKRTVTLTQVEYTDDTWPYTHLTAVTFPDGAVMQYTYYPVNAEFNYRHRLKTVYDSEANYGVEFGYSYASNVSSFYEYIVSGGTTVYGAKYHGYKRAHSQTAYRYYGKDGKPYMDEDGKIENATSTDDLVTVKVLDNYGRTVGSYTSNWNETEILGAGAASYTQNSGTSRTNNRITASASAGQQGVNLLKNSSAENEASGWINANANPSDHFIGNKSFTTTNTAFYQTVSLTSGEDYTFSAYVKIPEGTTFSSTGGVHLAFRSNGGSDLVKSETVNYSTTSMQGGWMRLTVTFTAGNAIDYQVAVVPNGVTGSIFVDALQLEKGKAASTYNIVENGSFEFYSTMPPAEDSALFGWFSAAEPTLSTDDVPFGSRRVSMLGAEGVVRLNQHIQLALPGDTDFILSGWAKGNAKPDNATAITETDKPFFAMMIRLYYSDDTSEPYFFPFDAYYDGWQYMQCVVASKKSADVTITDAYVVAAYDNNINGTCFDNISLRMEPVQTYDYDTNGNVIAATQSGAGRNDAEYAENGVDLLQYTATNGTAYSFTYNAQHDVSTSVVDGITSTYDYDDAGNAISSVTTNSTDSKELKTTMTITSDGNHTKETVDVNGNRVENIPNAYSGQTIRTITHPDEDTSVTIRYRYTSSLHRLQSVELEQPNPPLWPEIYIYYDYEDGALSALQRRSTTDGANPKWQKYAFEKNEWGQETAITVSGGTAQSTYTSTHTLAEYEYEPNNGNLTKMYYGDAASDGTDYAEYFYDVFDRLIRIEYNNGRYITYTYNAEGSLAKTTYGDGNTEKGSYIFEYDSLGRLIRSVEYDGNGNLVQRTEQLYDGIGRLSSQNWVIGSTAYSESYTYDDPTATDTSGDGSLSTVTTGTGDTIEFSYDNLKRLSETEVTNDTGTLFRTGYSYVPQEEENLTSTQVWAYTVWNPNYTPIVSYRHEYDGVGNITKVMDAAHSNRTLAEYSYDKLGQLTQEVLYSYDEDGNYTTTTYTYTYDTAGNILTKSSGNVTKNYSYENSAWRDLLTAVNGTAISYENGNPLNYYNGETSYTNLTWENGRQLASITVDGSTYNYSYDGDGIRTQKIVDGVTHTYVTQNGKVMRETIGTGATAQVLDFIYDNNGKPFALIYTNGTAEPDTYYYVLNLQGDVVALMNAQRTTVAQYAYNAWGEILSATGAMAEMNPIRYRGYYFDAETGFYYLRSRYYDPVNCRFVNADTPEISAISAISISDTNLFTYCGNNPVSRADDGGEFWHVLVGAVVGAVVNVTVAILEGKPTDEIVISGLCGAASGALAATGVGGVFGQMAIGAGASALDSGYGNFKDVCEGEKTFGEATVNTLVNAGMGALIGAMGFEGKVPLKTPLKKPVWKAALEETIESVVTTAISWGTSKYSELAYNYYREGLKQ